MDNRDYSNLRYDLQTFVEDLGYTHDEAKILTAGADDYVDISEAVKFSKGTGKPVGKVPTAVELNYLSERGAQVDDEVLDIVNQVDPNRALGVDPWRELGSVVADIPQDVPLPKFEHELQIPAEEDYENAELMGFDRHELDKHMLWGAPLGVNMSESIYPLTQYEQMGDEAFTEMKKSEFSSSSKDVDPLVAMDMPVGTMRGLGPMVFGAVASARSQSDAMKKSRMAFESLPFDAQVAMWRSVKAINDSENKIASRESVESFAKNLAILQQWNKAEGALSETPHDAADEVDLFLARTFMTNPNAKMVLSKESFSDEAYRKVADPHYALMKIEGYLGTPGFALRAGIVKGLEVVTGNKPGPEEEDTFKDWRWDYLNPNKAGEDRRIMHARISARFADLVPGVVDGVAASAMAVADAYNFVSGNPAQQVGREGWFNELAKATVMIGFEVLADPFMMAGGTTLGLVDDALRQSAKGLAPLYQAAEFADKSKAWVTRELIKAGKAARTGDYDSISNHALRTYAEKMGEVINRGMNSAGGRLGQTLTMQYEIEKQFTKEVAKHIFDKYGDVFGRPGFEFRPFIFGSLPGIGDLPKHQLYEGPLVRNFLKENTNKFTASLARETGRFLDFTWKGVSKHAVQTPEGRLAYVLPDVSMEQVFTNAHAEIGFLIKKLSSPGMQTNVNLATLEHVNDMAIKLGNPLFELPIFAGCKLPPSGEDALSYIQRIEKNLEEVQEAQHLLSDTGIDELVDTAKLDEWREIYTAKVDAIRKDLKKSEALMDKDRPLDKAIQNWRQSIQLDLESLLLANTDFGRRAARSRLKEKLNKFDRFIEFEHANGSFTGYRRSLEQIRKGREIMERELDLIAEGKWPKRMEMEEAYTGANFKSDQISRGFSPVSEIRKEISRNGALFRAMADQTSAIIERSMDAVSGQVKTLAKAFPDPKERAAVGEAVMKATGITRQISARIRGKDHKIYVPLEPQQLKHQLDNQLEKTNYWHQLAPKQKDAYTELITYTQREMTKIHVEELRYGISAASKADYVPHILAHHRRTIQEAGFGSNLALNQKELSERLLSRPQSLTTSQLTADGIPLVEDLLAILATRKTQHQMLLAQRHLMRETVKQFGRRPRTRVVFAEQMNLISEVGSAAAQISRASEAVVRMSPSRVSKKGKVRWKADDEAVEEWIIPKYIDHAVRQANEFMSGESVHLWVMTEMNTLFRTLYTVPNPGYHMRNLFGDAFRVVVGADLRDPSKVWEGFVASQIPGPEIMAAMGWVEKLPDSQKVAVGAYVERYFKWILNQAQKPIKNWKGPGPAPTIAEKAAELRVAGVTGRSFTMANFGPNLLNTLNKYNKASKAGNDPSLLYHWAIDGGVLGAATGAAVGLGSSVSGDGSVWDKFQSMLWGAVTGGVAGSAFTTALKQFSPAKNFQAGMGKADLPVLFDFGANVQKNMEEMLRMTLALDQVANKQVSLSVARELVDKHLFNYKQKSTADKWTREIVPFWTWYRNMIPWLFNTLIEKPWTFSAHAHARRGFERYAHQTTWRDQEKTYGEIIDTYLIPSYHRSRNVFKLPFLKSEVGNPLFIHVDTGFGDINLIDPESNPHGVLGTISPVFGTLIMRLLSGSDPGTDPPHKLVNPFSPFPVEPNISRLEPMPRWMKALPDSMKLSLGAKRMKMLHLPFSPDPEEFPELKNVRREDMIWLMPRHLIKRQKSHPLMNKIVELTSIQDQVRGDKFKRLLMFATGVRINDLDYEMIKRATNQRQSRAANDIMSTYGIGRLGKGKVISH